MPSFRIFGNVHLEERPEQKPCHSSGDVWVALRVRNRQMYADLSHVSSKTEILSKSSSRQTRMSLCSIPFRGPEETCATQHCDSGRPRRSSNKHMNLCCLWFESPTADVKSRPGLLIRIERPANKHPRFHARFRKAWRKIVGYRRSF
jgi:hypothetical protein